MISTCKEQRMQLFSPNKPTGEKYLIKNINCEKKHRKNCDCCQNCQNCNQCLFFSGHVNSSLWLNVSKVTSLWGHSVVVFLTRCHRVSEWVEWVTKWQGHLLKYWQKIKSYYERDGKEKNRDCTGHCCRAEQWLFSDNGDTLIAD